MSATILLVDDSRAILQAIGVILRHAGHAVIEATSGEQALTKLRNGEKPNLILADLNMGGMSGIDLTRHARTLQNTRFTPILLLTAEVSKDKRIEAKSAGATGWIVKPVDAGALIKIVAQLVDCSTCRDGSAGGSCGAQEQVDFAVGNSAICPAAAGQSLLSKSA
ncbi:two-component system chemotaxis response regulator CheY [Rhodoblastus acidophilus]|uniref:response regulator n=1 Tax=Rhodoblastus acidophilus TaxID=1074 RepID=UPI00222589D5|nr:response regulator [Rhodoblastus acidophilus]MCW2282695.1 two-component system chemotaxis response regulator CheY [Rhodoblastus acidophilus]MCW2331556.1 two-component system chemotaxis response regulator CheY [Rhodoblastus acidophilus]